MALTLILSVGLDPDLLGTRNLVLQSAGYIVVSAYSIKDAFNLFQEGDFDLVLLCRSIPNDEIDRLTKWIRASGSRLPVVSVIGKFNQADVPAGLKVEGDPEALLEGIKEVLNNAATTPASPAAKSSNPLELAPASERKSPQSTTGTEKNSNTEKEHLAPLARTG